MELKNKKVLIVGIARSGIASAALCHQLGAEVVLYDGKERNQFEDIIKSLNDFNYGYIFGKIDEAALSGFDLLVLSPGVPTDLPFILKARALNIVVIGEIELAYAFCKSQIIAITGTNGKTTTTSLVGEICSAFNPDTFVVGNIGNPFTKVVSETKVQGIVVAEISSFQLETVDQFHPKVSAILNLTEDHLNRHKTFENYIHTKLRITENQVSQDYCILNYDDPLCRALEDKIKSQIVWFSMTEKVKGVYHKDGEIIINFNGLSQTFISMDEVFLFGKHNVENIMAAVAICMCVAIPLEVVKSIVSSFKGVEHRVEFVREVRQVKYYNDSKATNPDSAIAAIRAMRTPTVLIGGGMDKGNTFDEWIMSFDNKIKALIVFGETKYNIEETAKRCHYSPVIVVDKLEEAVDKAVEIAVSGDSILLSPACASWDMFTSYEERGQLFKELVTKL